MEGVEHDLRGLGGVGRVRGHFLRAAVKAVWTPANITTALWLDAADTSTFYDATTGGSLVANNGAIARWEDKSGNARHATESTSGNRPLRVDAVQNARPVVRFDGTDDCLRIISPFLQATNTFTISWVFTRRGAGTGLDAYRPEIVGSAGGGGDGTYHFIKNSNNLGAAYPHYPSWGSYDFTSGTAYATGTFEIMQFRAATSRWDIYRNGAVEGGYNIEPALPTTYVHGGLVLARQDNPTRTSNIDMCEVIVNLGSLSAVDTQKLEGYLAHKWGLTANLPSDHPYKTTAPTT